MHVQPHHYRVRHMEPCHRSNQAFFFRNLALGAMPKQQLAGDVETNPGPSCYACGKNFRQSDTPLNCHAPDCGVRSHRQTRCIGAPRSQQSLPWHCPTHGGPWPPVTTQTSHACYSCHHPFRPDTRPFACLAQGCMNLAHAARRCSGPTAPPDPGRCLHHHNITETVAGVSASALTPRERP